MAIVLFILLMIVLGIVVTMGLAVELGPIWPFRVPPPPRKTLDQIREHSTKLERELGLLFDGVFLLPGYWRYEGYWPKGKRPLSVCLECGDTRYHVSHACGCTCGSHKIDSDPQPTAWIVKDRAGTTWIIKSNEMPEGFVGRLNA